MDNKAILNLVDTALNADIRAVKICVRKLTSQVCNKNNELYEELMLRLETNGLRAIEQTKPLPVDSDSRLSLIRFESPVIIDSSPVHTKEIEERLKQVVLERAHFRINFGRVISGKILIIPRAAWRRKNNVGKMASKKNKLALAYIKFSNSNE